MSTSLLRFASARRRTPPLRWPTLGLLVLLACTERTSTVGAVCPAPDAGVVSPPSSDAGPPPLTPPEELWSGAQANVSGALAADADHLYLGTNGGLVQVRKDGGGATTLATGRCRAVAANGTHVFWVNADTDAVERVDPAGAGRQVVLPAPAGQNLARLLADDAFLYWTRSSATQGGLFRARTDGSEVTELSSGMWNDLALSDSALYGLGLGGVMTVGTDGAGLRLLVPMTGVAWGLFADTQVFWATLCSGGSGQCHKLYRVEPDGSGQVVVNHFTAAGALAADAAHLYFAVNGQLFRTRRDGTAVEVVAAGVRDVRAGGLLLDDTHVYWFDGDGSGTSRLMRHARTP